MNVSTWHRQVRLRDVALKQPGLRIDGGAPREGARTTHVLRIKAGCEGPRLKVLVDAPPPPERDKRMYGPNFRRYTRLVKMQQHHAILLSIACRQALTTRLKKKVASKQHVSHPSVGTADILSTTPLIAVRVHITTMIEGTTSRALLGGDTFLVPWITPSAAHVLLDLVSPPSPSRSEESVASAPLPPL